MGKKKQFVTTILTTTENANGGFFRYPSEDSGDLYFFWKQNGLAWVFRVIKGEILKKDNLCNHILPNTVIEYIPQPLWGKFNLSKFMINVFAKKLVEEFTDC